MLKRALITNVLVFASMLSAIGSANANEIDPKVEAGPDQAIEKDAEAPDIMDWVMEEVLPAFGNLKNLQFAQAPILSASFMKAGGALNSCRVEANITQLKEIKYNIIKIPSYIDGSVDIGSEKKINFSFLCGEINVEPGVKNLYFRVYFTNQGEASRYNLEIHMMEQTQKILQMEYIDFKAKVITKEEQILVTYNGEAMPYLESYEEYKRGDVYQIPVALWKEKGSSVRGQLPTEDQGLKFIPASLEKSIERIELKGEMKSLFPIGDSEGRSVYTDYFFNMDGKLYKLEDQMMLPLIRTVLIGAEDRALLLNKKN